LSYMDDKLSEDADTSDTATRNGHAPVESDKPEFEKFEDLARRLMDVKKSELDEKRKTATT
jgi:hypothetical protein